ncbi:MAG TPA: cytochrome c peroxidase [Polyangia bacterium]|nr:cytochrome c peroxidase [Polyangia bacterium]
MGIRALATGLLLATVAERARAATPPTPSAAEMIALGRRIFADPALSDPPGTSCASCHDPSRAYSSLNGSRNGLPRGSRPGHFARRTAPSLLYLRYVPSFRFRAEGGQEGDDPGAQPFGGLFWDGRVDTVRDLGRQPLLNPDEMNNRDGRRVAEAIRRGPYAPAFAAVFGSALDDPEPTLAAVGKALEAFLTADDMAPFSSRYDDFVRGRAPLAPLEAEGLRLYKDPAKGGCAGCHLLAEAVRDPVASMFTDYGYEAVAIPRNQRAPRRPTPDLGLCERTDRATPSDDPSRCLYFRTPSLRNVAVRGSYMHNGAFRTLREVVAFYATRATDPRRWYHSGIPFDSVPAKYRGRVNVTSPPYDRKPGQAPALDDHEIDAIVAFLRTLTDAPYRSAAAR